MISTRHALLLSSLLFGLADRATHAAITGQWDFNSDLSATIGQPIQPMDPGKH